MTFRFLSLRLVTEPWSSNTSVLDISIARLKNHELKVSHSDVLPLIFQTM